MAELNAPSNGFANDLPEMITNRLRIEGILGRGGMGTVYLATHLSLDRLVALKVINPEFAANTDVSQRFAREARLMAKLRHPRAAMIYDAGSMPDGRSFIVMEYVEGKTLAQVLKEEGRLPYQKAVEIAVSICDVLSFAHSLGIIHRDLKPANIMLNGEGVFVLDFGIAKMLESENDDGLGLSMTGTGILVGSPYYMSPEQCLGQPVEARSDLYGLGILLYEALAGSPPFTDKTISAVVIKHATADPPSLAELCADVPLPVIAVINKLLAKKPEDRPATAAAARTMLETSIGEQPSATPTLIMTKSNPVIPSISEFKSGEQTILINGARETQHLDSALDTKVIRDSNASSATSSGNNRLLVFGLAAALIAVVGLSATALIWQSARSRAEVNAALPVAPTANNSKAVNSDAHQNHAMPMGPDFTAVTNPNDEKVNTPSVPLLTSEEADAVITKITQTTEHRADGMQIVKTPKDTALVCIHNMIEEGKTHLFAVERPNPNGAWAITARVSLDQPEFHGANWKFEPQDVDKDGFEEVIFNGSNADNTARRSLIYVPRTRQNYWIQVQTDQSGKILGKTFSPNAQTPNAAAFRTALEQTVSAR